MSSTNLCSPTALLLADQYMGLVMFVTVLSAALICAGAIACMHPESLWEAENKLHQLIKHHRLNILITGIALFGLWCFMPSHLTFKEVVHQKYCTEQCKLRR